MLLPVDMCLTAPPAAWSVRPFGNVHHKPGVLFLLANEASMAWFFSGHRLLSSTVVHSLMGVYIRGAAPAKNAPDRSKPDQNRA